MFAWRCSNELLQTSVDDSLVIIVVQVCLVGQVRIQAHHIDVLISPLCKHQGQELYDD